MKNEIRATKAKGCGENFMPQPKNYAKNIGRFVYLTGEICEEVAQQVNIRLLELQKDDPLGEITLFIDSYGGEIYSAFAITDMMAAITCDIRTICIGKAMSAGQFIFSTGTKGKRYITKNSRLMIHNPAGGFVGDVPTIEVEVDELMKTRDTFVRHISDHSNLTVPQVIDMIQRNKYLSAEEAIEMGFADHILTRIK